MDAAQLDPHEMPYTVRNISHRSHGILDLKTALKSYTIGAAGQVNNVHRDQYIVCEAHPVHGQLVATSPGLIAENTLKGDHFIITQSNSKHLQPVLTIFLHSDEYRAQFSIG